MPHVLSENAKLFRNTGTFASPTWDEITLVKDLSISLDKDETDVTVRASGGFKEFVDGMIDASLEFSMLYDDTDTDFTALRTAFFAKTQVEVLVLDGAATGAGSTGNQGLRARMMVKSMTRNENLGEALMMDITMRPVKNSDGPPTWFIVP
jgi:hypothetical protein